MKKMNLSLAVIICGLLSLPVAAQVGKKGEGAMPSSASSTKTTPTKKSAASAKGGGSKTSKRSTGIKRDQGKSVEQTYWESIKDSANVEDFQSYLRKYPSGKFAGLAQNKISSLETAERERGAERAQRQVEDARRAENTYWESVKNSNNPEDFRAYLRKYPNGEFADLARNRIGSLKASDASIAPEKSQVSGNAPSFKACDSLLGRGIYDKWLQVKNNRFFFCPATNESEAGRSPRGTTGRFSLFKGDDALGVWGMIVWHGSGEHAGKAFAVYGCNYKMYSVIGGPASWLGFPISDEYDASGGRRNDFEGGYIFWDAKKDECQAHKR